MFYHSLDLHSDWSKKTQATRDDFIPLICESVKVAMRDYSLRATAVRAGQGSDRDAEIEHVNRVGGEVAGKLHTATIT
jgi:hypothetical protein